MGQKQKKITIIVCAVIIFAAVARLTPFLGLKSLEKFEASVKIVNVGQGSAAIISDKNNAVIIDFGTKESVPAVINTAKSAGIEKFDYAIISHLHDDHIGGFCEIINNIGIDKTIADFTPTEDCDKTLVGNVINEAKEKSQIIYPKVGKQLSAGNIIIDILYTGRKSDDANEHSLICSVTVRGIKFLFTGDSTEKNEKELLQSDNITCDVLIAGHHGSNYSSSTKFLQKIKPQYVAVSCGYDNSYSFPGNKAADRITSCGATLYRTDVDGSITFTVKSGKIKVNINNA